MNKFSEFVLLVTSDGFDGMFLVAVGGMAVPWILRRKVSFCLPLIALKEEINQPVFDFSR